MTDPALAKRIYDTSHLTGSFTLRSGVTATEYFDKYRFESDPALLRDITAAMVPFVADGVDALAGLEMGGIPIATMLSSHTGVPAQFVRKQAKTYGTCRLAEGGRVEGMRLLVVEDVVTSGGQIVESVGELRDRGAIIDTAVCVIDRQAGGVENLAEIGVTLRALFTMQDLKDAAS